MTRVELEILKKSFLEFVIKRHERKFKNEYKWDKVSRVLIEDPLEQILYHMTIYEQIRLLL